MHPRAWVAAHVAALVSVGIIGLCAGDAPPNLVLYGLPVAVGTVQWAFLSQHLRWWGLLWLPACLFGLLLSFFGIWWFFLVVGAGIGVAQAPILAVTGFRRCWVWVLASGLGWFIGVALASKAVDILGALLGTEAARIGLMFGLIALGYGTLTAGALHVMLPGATAETAADDPLTLGEADPGNAGRAEM